MIIYGKNVYTDIDYNSDIIEPDIKSIQSIINNNYFESIIQNCVQFFDSKYLYTFDYLSSYEMELNRILDNPDKTNNLGKLIYNIYNRLINNGKSKSDIIEFIYTNFFYTTSPLSLSDKYFTKKENVLHISRQFGLQNVDYTKLANMIDSIITGTNYDFSNINIDCIVYRSKDFDIKPSALYQVAMEYDAILLSHNRHNENYWKIDPIEIEDKSFTNLEECLQVIHRKNILVLSCNDDGHIIKDIDGKHITVPQYPLISELYL